MVNKVSKKTKARRAPQERGKKTREILLQAAIDSLKESNLFSLRFSQISKAAKVPQPLMDYHFPSLEALLMEMVHHELTKLRLRSLDAIQNFATKPRKALEAYIRAPFELAEEDAGFRAVWSCYYHLATTHQTFSDFNRGIRKMGNERIFTLIVSVLNAENKGRHLSKTKLLNETATQIQGLITGLGFMAGAESEGNFKDLADLAVKASAQLLAVNFPL